MFSITNSQTVWLDVPEIFHVKWKSFFSHSFQTCNLTGRLKTSCDGTRRQQVEMEMETLCKWNGNFHDSDQLEWKMWNTSKGCFPKDLCIPFAFQPVLFALQFMQ